jgi:ATP-dependent Clp protease ATP-binding subunit ClpB
LKRTIQRRILDPLAMKVLQGDFTEGDLVRIDADGGELRFTRQQEPAASARAAG